MLQREDNDRELPLFGSANTKKISTNKLLSVRLRVKFTAQVMRSWAVTSILGGNYWKKFLPALVGAVCVVGPGLQLAVGLTHTTPEPAGCCRKQAQRPSCSSSEKNKKYLLVFRQQGCCHVQVTTPSLTPEHQLAWWPPCSQSIQPVHLGALDLCPRSFPLCLISSSSPIQSWSSGQDDIIITFSVLGFLVVGCNKKKLEFSLDLVSVIFL